MESVLALRKNEQRKILIKYLKTKLAVSGLLPNMSCNIHAQSSLRKTNHTVEMAIDPASSNALKR